MKVRVALIALLSCHIALGQGAKKRALFLGNSYTNVNNLPKMVADIAASMGDTLIYDSNTPGGYTLQAHSTNATSLAKIGAGNWDFVILQEQSQYPSFPLSQVEAEVFPYARFLDSTINAQNPCVETVFYMTWGRKNGDASNCAAWPPVCTYQGMDSLLNLRYRMMAENNEAILSPVGAVWKYIRQNFPSIELYQPDASHPSVAGTYAAACSFYTSLFRRDPADIIFNASLSAADAENIRTAAKWIVFDSLLTWHIGAYDPIANFTLSISNGNEVQFSNSSVNASDFYWIFGDGDTTNEISPTHLFDTSGNFTVQLVAEKCGMSDTISKTISIDASYGMNEESLKDDALLYPNPVKSVLYFKADISNHLDYSIINISGQEIQAGHIDISEKKLNVESIPPGMYLLRLFQSDQMIRQQKFIKTAQ